MSEATSLRAGGAEVEITPRGSVFLFGYPHVPRMSTGVHDPLYASALYMEDGTREVLFVANDVIFVSKPLARRARERIGAATGISAECILISATHTHSGPVTVDYLSNEADPVVPRADAAYLQQLEDGIVRAGVEAWRSCRPAEAALIVAHGAGVGTHRHDPHGPSDPQVPVLLVRGQDNAYIAAMLVCCMHPTVLHEDSTLISGDFPGLCRRHLKDRLLGQACPVLHHTGPCGNQSPRHVTRANTFAEADRLGGILADAVMGAARSARYLKEIRVQGRSTDVPMPARQFIAVGEAEERVKAARARFEELARTKAERTEVRTAECDVFGAEELLVLSRAAAEGRIDAALAGCLPAEAQVIQVGPWRFVGWPGEIFVEYGLQVKQHCPDTFVISLANGELQGYLVTPEAAAGNWYEANNALVASPQGPQRLLEATLQLLREI